MLRTREKHTFAAASGSGTASAASAVGLDVLGEVVGAHEALVADRASETLFARVGSQVTLQLVGAGEALAAEEPVANKWPLSGVPAKMGLQMARLAVHLPAAGNVATVDVALAEMSTCRAQSVCLLAVGTIACCPACVTAR